MSGLLTKLISGGKRDSLPRKIREFPIVIERIERIDLRLSADASVDDRNRAIREALSLTVGSKGDVPIGLVVPPSGSFVKFAKLPPVSPDKVPEIVQFEAGQSIPFDLDQVVWDYVSATQDDDPCIECCIVARRKSLIEADLAPFNSDRRLRRRVDLIQASELTVPDYLWNCHFAQADSKKPGFLLGLSIDSQVTNLVITDGQTLWTRCIPIGRAAFSKPHAASSASSACDTHGASDENAADLVPAEYRAIAADFVSEVQRSVGFFASTHRDCIVTGVTFLGDRCEPWLGEYVRNVIQLKPVEIPFARGVRQSLALQSDVINNHGPTLTDALTVAMQRLGIGKFRLNLYPDGGDAFGLEAQSAWGIAIQPNALVAVLVSRDSK